VALPAQQARGARRETALASVFGRAEMAGRAAAMAVPVFVLEALSVFDRSQECVGAPDDGAVSGEFQRDALEVDHV
jgi:hypothetical protein